VNEATHADGTIDVSGCTSCHGKAAGSASPAAPLDAAPPVDTLGASTGLRVGAHQKHLLGGAYANAIPCATCHAGVAGYASGHANGVNEVGFTGGANANLRKGSWTPRSGSTAGRCGATWCHGAVISRYGGTVGGTLTAPYWNGTTTITSCSACHTVSYSSLPGRHSKHSRYGCGECHAGCTSSVVNKSLHVNGVKNVSGNRINSWSGTSCSTSCHGSEQWY
jgi:predicted CxxxxCH...CXXCH cytochrome family protein